MSEMQSAMALINAPKSTAILRYPSGRFGIVGSIPYELTKPRGGLFPGRDSMVWKTEQEVIEALLGIGITKFQKADCSFYQLEVAK